MSKSYKFRDGMKAAIPVSLATSASVQHLVSWPSLRVIASGKLLACPFCSTLDPVSSS